MFRGEIQESEKADSHREGHSRCSATELQQPDNHHPQAILAYVLFTCHFPLYFTSKHTPCMLTYLHGAARRVEA